MGYFLFMFFVRSRLHLQIQFVWRSFCCYYSFPVVCMSSSSSRMGYSTARRCSDLTFELAIKPIINEALFSRSVALCVPLPLAPASRAPRALSPISEKFNQISAQFNHDSALKMTVS